MRTFSPTVITMKGRTPSLQCMPGSKWRFSEILQLDSTPEALLAVAHAGYKAWGKAGNLHFPERSATLGSARSCAIAPASIHSSAIRRMSAACTRLQGCWMRGIRAMLAGMSAVGIPGLYAGEDVKGLASKSGCRVSGGGAQNVRLAASTDGCKRAVCRSHVHVLPLARP